MAVIYYAGNVSAYRVAIQVAKVDQGNLQTGRMAEFWMAVWIADVNQGAF